jgi:hypothetical protein
MRRGQSDADPTKAQFPGNVGATTMRCRPNAALAGRKKNEEVIL